ncbi:MAG: DUF3159 domain-containing protein [Leucobacter sp.]
MSGGVEDQERGSEALSHQSEDQQRQGANGVGAAQSAAAKAGGALGRTVEAGLSGEAVSVRGVLAAIGGVRGVIETLVPGILYLVVYVFTQDAYTAVIAPAAIAVIAVAVRLIRREPTASAFSGAIGVAVCVAFTLWTGQGTGYFIPGFWINGAWILGLGISLIVGWPLIGLAVGALRGDLTGWRRDRTIFRLSAIVTLVWLLLFVARLAVQLPLYFADNTEALGIARLVMGVPLFALVVILSWMLLGRAAQEKGSSEDGGPASPDTQN